VSLALNPVFGRELKERFRTRRAPIFITLWVLAVGLIGYLVYLVAQTTARTAFGIGQGVAAGFMGKFMFEGMLLLLMTAVVMIVPGLTALSIVAERERQTFHLLQVTQLTPRQIVIGKLSSSMSYFLLLLVATAPVVALPLLFGGVRLGDVAVGLGMLVLTALTLGTVGIWSSARARSSRGAVAGAYTWAFTLAFITFAAMGAELLLVRDGPIFPPRGREIFSVLPNPYVGMVSAVVAPLGSDGFQGTPFDPIEMLLMQRQGFDQFGWRGGAPFIGGEARALPLRRPEVWLYTVAIYATISTLALVGAVRRVRAPARKVRSGRSRDAGA
jgi:ABC-type transport system involved in multi-copper enzyme maturation permease subunit